MGIDTSMYNGLMQKPKSIAEYDAERLQVQQAQQQNRLADLVYGEKQREISGDNALASLLAGGKSGADVSQGLAAAGYGNKSMAYTKSLQEQEKQKADIDHLKSQSGKLNAETLEKALETTRSFANQVDTPQAAAMYLKGVYAHPLLGPVAASMMPIDQAMASIPQDMNSPDGLRWKAAHVNLSGKDLLGLLMPKTDSANLGGNMSFGKTDQFSGVRTQTGEAPITQSADNAATNATSRANNAAQLASAAATRAQADRHFQAGQNTPQYMETDAGLVALPKKLAPGQVPAGMPVVGADGQPLGKPLKAIPATVNTAIIANNQSLSQLDRTIALLEGKDQGSQKGDKDATGIKGYLPQQILNAVDPKGVEARAGVADIGSLKLHDRSGAAVTASESPRLMPFIPLTTDSNETALKKLRRLRQEVATESDAISQTYSRDQGYKPSPIKPASSSGGIPSGWSVKEH